LVAGLGFVGL
jgi:hypothetical protein